MQIIEMLKIPKYLFLAIVSTIILFIIYAHIQLFGIWENFFFWLSIFSIFSIITVGLFVILFGLMLSFQIYTFKRRSKTCPIKRKQSGIGGIGTIGFMLVAQCSACATLGIFFLPFSLVSLIVEFNWLISLISIGLLLFSLNYLGAFKK
ncbi:MAG: hypothetical protein HON47_01360 [Candidatus Diapherotrites archaeon]|jgi:hypothetical protein|uniref:Uncharacterized protein n=1 Tax=Candidatus Iainarchaeum sp. TaxID=3101447 RepID=A0A8T5GDV2_9ARCH|nr:hypothetical protein [Candidatus Diapherotrites archaeon]MBT7241437.1 hypothetical protein [Candidatus Diapherotrites archaeon]